ncbi:peptidylprolyl isomerase [Pontibacter chitinilyticus]|uniref:peptidylprolyl isomerase n=1 Tax=Pontibacter chitinilyticus TaxID=2674989 RepID=UPI00321B69B1
MRKQRPAITCLFTLLLTCLLPLSSCNQGSPSEKQEDESTAKATAEPKLDPLTSENVVGVLTTYGEKNQDSIAVISTRLGDITVRLYKDTPLHRANFIRLAKAGFYNEGEFYRVVKGFAIQGGDSDERKMKQGAYKIPQEITPKHIHKKGALAMARYGDERNPEKESSSHNFYIVQGKPRTEAELRAYEAKHHIQYTPEQMKVYETIGGEPGLDSEYTVFGEVIDGLDVVDKIADVPVEAGNWPKELVKHTIKIMNK